MLTFDKQASSIGVSVQRPLGGHIALNSRELRSALECCLRSLLHMHFLVMLLLVLFHVTDNKK